MSLKTNSEDEYPPCQIIKEIPVIHCKRGPKNCKKCKEVYKISYALLDICPEGEYARPVTEVIFEGKKTYRVYDVIKRFNSIEEAKEYAIENQILFAD